MSHTLFDTAALIASNGGKAPTTMAGFQKLVMKTKVPAPAPDAPATMPPVDTAVLQSAGDATLQAGGSVPELSDLGLSLPDSGPAPFPVGTS